MDNIKETLNQLYKKKTYFDIYGGSLFMTFFIFFIFFIAISYFYVMNNIKPIKRNWTKERCSPSIIPFAGLINSDPNMSSFDYTSKNFSFCVNNILTSIASKFLQPIYYVMKLVDSTINDVVESVQMVRKKINSFVSNIESIDREIMTRIFNVLQPIHIMFIKMKDLLAKINATMITSIYSMISGYFAVKAFTGAFVKIMIIGLISLTAIIIPLLFFFFTIPLAVPLLVIYGIVAGFTTSVIVGLEDIIHMSSSSVPPKPHCFDENTELKLNDGSIKKIKDILIDDTLIDGSRVTSKFKVIRNGQDMYLHNGVIVSGCHNIWNGRENTWKPVCLDKYSYLIGDYTKDFIYCINTTNKYIHLNGTYFSDWHDIDKDELNILERNFMLKGLIDRKIETQDFHSVLEGGFGKDTKILLKGNITKPINRIKNGDVLINNSKVIGIVEISTKDMNIYEINLNDHNLTKKQGNDKNTNVSKIIIGNNNLLLTDCNTFTSTISLYNKKQIENKPNKLYHLLIDNDSFILENGYVVKDYNASIEVYLE